MEQDADLIEPSARPAWAGLAGDIAPIRLGDAVIERLTRAILDGALKPGDALPSEAHIASTFGVSKPIAREALRELAAMGVVQVQQGKVSRVRAIDSGPLSRIYRFAMARTERGLQEAVELRRLLEPPIARFAAQRHTADELAAFGGILAAMKAAQGDIPRWIEADLAFHRHLAVMAHNGLVALQMQGLEPIVREMMAAFNAHSARAGSDWRATYERHVRVLEGVASRDADAAEAAVRAHFTAADKVIAEIFGGARAPDG
jgi:GntR family transcriptional repressor for pyruvate dehydrogenase complex